ncbi:Cytochrome c oxidase subunit 2 precursor [Jannaschia seosinensis]|uniref:Cytochrome c oxidase subunit 2 n=1 Tax=Jannaschia seosinensis TaxID=313367 RepID=A0A0M7B9U1_9RHOB|nr:cytochrome c oxidase subunit II [Jannaschia seosinensis]CUH39141.1 Cytochrome c oxidase subunit 2 precursor [Jannaschia seosinensis]
MKLLSPKAFALKAAAMLAALPALAQDAVVVPETEPAPGPFFRDLEVIGQPQPGGVGFQPASTSLAFEVNWLDGLLLVMIAIITIFVTGLLAWVILRYNHRANPNPAAFTHNSPLEVTWTIVPILILVSIGAFSLPVLFDQQRIPNAEADVVVKVSGFQWAWNYDYVDEDIAFDSYMIGADTGNQLTADSLEDLRLAGYAEEHFRLATDTSVVVPVNQTIVMQVTATDVIHSWTIPSFGVKQDGIPGRLAQLWFRAEEEGVYFGQCSELCGISHAFMPITVKVVSEAEYARWLAAMKSDNPPLTW